MNDFTLCYNAEDGKFHIGRGCGEIEEKFVGEISDEIAEVDGFTADGLTLYLKGFKFETSADIAMALPGGTVLVLEGDNEIKVTSDREDANVGVLYSSGDLTINGSADSTLAVLANTEQGLWSRAICARAGDLTINGGKITARGGKAKKSCGVYAGGHLWIEIGDKGKITVNGGALDIISGRNAIRAAEGLLTVAAGAKVENVLEYQGGEEFHGDCISPVDIEKPVIISL